tara:strand:- start:637 stop:1281 length:645 start_codon:yes stop_codon:yes gene_type:complete
MGTSAVDLMQSSDIAQLQTDVTELNTKLNALIIEFNKCSDDTTTNADKITSLINDVGDINDKISLGYVATTIPNSGDGSAADSILTRIQDLDGDFVALEGKVDTHIGHSPGLQGVKDSAGNNILIYASMTSSHPHSGTGASSNRGGGAGGILIPVEDLDAASSSGSGDDTSVNASSSSVGGVYSTAAVKVLTLGSKPEARARKLARKTLNRLRK